MTAFCRSRSACRPASTAAQIHRAGGKNFLKPPARSPLRSKNSAMISAPSIFAQTCQTTGWFRRRKRLLAALGRLPWAGSAAGAVTVTASGAGARWFAVSFFLPVSVLPSVLIGGLGGRSSDDPRLVWVLHRLLRGLSLGWFGVRSVPAALGTDACRIQF